MKNLSNAASYGLRSQLKIHPRFWTRYSWCFSLLFCFLTLGFIASFINSSQGIYISILMYAGLSAGISLVWLISIVGFMLGYLLDAPAPDGERVSRILGQLNTVPDAPSESDIALLIVWFFSGVGVVLGVVFWIVVSLREFWFLITKPFTKQGGGRNAATA